MWNLVVIVLFIIWVALIFLFGLFQTTPSSTNGYFERVFSTENLILNGIIVVGSALVVGAAYWINHARRKHKPDETDDPL